MSLDQRVESLQMAIRNTSGNERRMYEALLNYLSTQRPDYESAAKKYYRHLDYQAQRRAEAVVGWLAEAGQYCQ